MDKSSRGPSACCALAKRDLVADLRQCDMCTTSYDEFHACYRAAARASADSARRCMTD